MKGCSLHFSQAWHGKKIVSDIQAGPLLFPIHYEGKQFESKWLCESKTVPHLDSWGWEPWKAWPKSYEWEFPVGRKESFSTN